MSRDSLRPRVVFDCMIYLQAIISDTGPAAVLLRLVESDMISLFVSGEILDEVRDVLSRPRIRQRNPEITDERVDAFISRISDQAAMIADVRPRFSYSRDPKDEKYINLAVEVEASYLVSRDKDLLDLLTGYTDECKDFRRRFRLVRVIEPVEFVKSVLPAESSESGD